MSYKIVFLPQYKPETHTTEDTEDAVLATREPSSSTHPQEAEMGEGLAHSIGLNVPEEGALNITDLERPMPKTAEETDVANAMKEIATNIPRPSGVSS